MTVAREFSSEPASSLDGSRFRWSYGIWIFACTDRIIGRGVISSKVSTLKGGRASRVFVVNERFEKIFVVIDHSLSYFGINMLQYFQH